MLVDQLPQALEGKTQRKPLIGGRQIPFSVSAFAAGAWNKIPEANGPNLLSAALRLLAVPKINDQTYDTGEGFTVAVSLIAPAAASAVAGLLIDSLTYM